MDEFFEVIKLSYFKEVIGRVEGQSIDKMIDRHFKSKALELTSPDICRRCWGGNKTKLVRTNVYCAGRATLIIIDI